MEQQEEGHSTTDTETSVQQHQSSSPLPEQQCQEIETKKPILTIYSFDVNPTRYSFSSFVTKLHFRLRYSGIPYQNGFGSKFQAPKGKIPYVEFHETGEIVGDSGLIIQRLMATMGDMDVNSDLDLEKRATDYALRKAVEEGGYFVTLYERWYSNYYAMRDQGPFAALPWGVRHVMTALAYRYAGLMLYMQGTGRYTPDEVARLRGEMIGMLANFAEAARRKNHHHHRPDDDNEEEREFEPFWILGGEKPTEADFTVFGYFSGLLATATQPATTALIKSHPALVNYVKRIHDRYFPDFEPLGFGVVDKDDVE